MKEAKNGGQVSGQQIDVKKLAKKLTSAAHHICHTSQLANSHKECKITPKEKRFTQKGTR